MLSLQASTPSLTAASVQYRRDHKLRRAWRAMVGVRCTATYVGASSPSTFPVPWPTLEKVNKMTSRKNGVASEMSTLGEKMRFGGFEPGELVYKERFVCCRLGWSTDGFPSPPTMRKHRLIWITSRAHIEMYQYPAWGDVVEIEHWCEPDGKIAARFDSIIRNSSTGEVIGRATSKWLMMNRDTRKLHKISGEVREEYLAVCPKSSRLSFPEVNNGSLKKIPKLDEPADYSQLGLVPRRADLDMNKHVNNVTYISWLLQSIPQDIVETHELVAITLEYRHECKYSDSVDSLASIEVEVESDSNANTEDHRQFLHLLKFSGTNHEVNRGRTVWRKLER